jgi:hypothetical protein
MEGLSMITKEYILGLIIAMGIGILIGIRIAEK